MKLILSKLLSCVCVLLMGLIAFVILEGVFFSANLNQPDAAIPYFSVLCIIIVCVMLGLKSAVDDKHYGPPKR